MRRMAKIFMMVFLLGLFGTAAQAIAAKYRVKGYCVKYRKIRKRYKYKKRVGLRWRTYYKYRTIRKKMRKKFSRIVTARSRSRAIRSIKRRMRCSRVQVISAKRIGRRYSRYRVKGYCLKYTYRRIRKRYKVRRRVGLRWRTYYKYRYIKKRVIKRKRFTKYVKAASSRIARKKVRKMMKRKCKRLTITSAKRVR